MAAPVVNGVQIACELALAAAQMVEMRFRRENPDASEDQVRVRVEQWWSDRPGAPFGDSDGRPRALSSLKSTL